MSIGETNCTSENGKPPFCFCKYDTHMNKQTWIETQKVVVDFIIKYQVLKGKKP